MTNHIDIIIPVYDGYEETIQCIESVLASDIGLYAHITVVNDCSPNDALVTWMRDQAASGCIELHENKHNLGFVGTVNKGMSLHPDRDVILLNSDTIVTHDWVKRLASHACKDGVASVTPFSNNATICSFPNFCDENPLLTSVGEIDAAFSFVYPGKSVEIPTAVGFCMYINRQCLKQVGMFDEKTFGRGYGEENDFCMRATQQGWRHLIAADVFVAHVGGVSFSEEKAARVESAQKILDRLYPDYHSNVQRFIAADPLREIRMKVHAALIHHSQRKSILLVSHRLSGGVETHLRELQDYFGSEGFFPVLRPGVEAGEYELALSVRSQDKISFVLPDGYNKLLGVCRFLGVGRIYFHHTMGIDPVISGLAEDLGCGMDYMVHDYYMVNANPTLTDDKGRFCADKKSRDALCAKHYALPFGVSAEQWRQGQLSFLSRCDHVVAPCAYTAKLFSDYFPDVTVDVAYHLDSNQASYPTPVQVAREDAQCKDILVIGAISREKGADILESVARLAKKIRPLWRFHLLGYAYRPLDCVLEHGPYADVDVDEKIAAIAADIIWFPALWPETYSYTLSEALRSGVPILASDIGAFPERLAGRPHTSLAAWDSSEEDWLAQLDALLSRVGEAVDVSNAWKKCYERSENHFYADFWSRVGCPEKQAMDLDPLLGQSCCRESVSRREQWLLRLLLIRNHPAMRWVVRFIPFALQQKTKRWFSRRPIHDIYTDRQ